MHPEDRLEKTKQNCDRIHFTEKQRTKRAKNIKKNNEKNQLYHCFLPKQHRYDPLPPKNTKSDHENKKDKNTLIEDQKQRETQTKEQ